MIKEILDEIANESSTKKKDLILKKYVDNELLKRVIYLATSRRVKFYIKQVPEFQYVGDDEGLEQALDKLSRLTSRELTGGAAINHLAYILSSINPSDQIVIERIIGKDLKIGFGTTNINKVFKGLIEKTPYMGAKAFSEDLAKKIFKGGAVAVSQVKMDGRYCNAIIRGGEVELESRQGETTFIGNAKMLRELSVMSDCVLNGELTIDGLNRYIANGVIASIIDIEENRLKRGEDETNEKIESFNLKHGSYEDMLSRIRYTVWDMITIEEYFDGVSSREYAERAALLSSTINKYLMTRVVIVEGAVVTTYEEAMLHFQQILKRGDEGTILKALNGKWKDGKPNWQVKCKVEIDLDLIITGFNYGNKGTKNENLISSIDVKSSCGKLKTSPAGINESTMKFITENQDKLLNTIVEVKCSGLSHNSKMEYSLLHPVFKTLRDDKLEGNTLEECIQISNAALGLS